MTNSDRERFGRILLAMSEYYDKPMSEALVKMWWLDLEVYDLSAIERAFHQYRRSDSGQYMPKTNDIIKLIEGSTEDRALRAWATVEKIMRTVGGYESVTFDDAVVMLVLHEMGGWERLCRTTKESELPFVSKEFVNRYRGHLKQGMPVEYPNRLIGEFERENRALGKPNTASPVLIGNREKALMILQSGKQTMLPQLTSVADAIKNSPMIEKKTGESDG